jgi:hypothetical protein
MQKSVWPPAVLISFSTILVPQFGAAQDMNVNVQQQRAQVTSEKSTAAEPKLTKAQRERAMQLLEGAEAGASGLDPASRAFVLIQVSRAYQSADRKKAVELLEQAITSAKLVGQDDDRFKGLGTRLQEQAAQAMVPLAPEKADELLPQLDPRSREQVFNSLLDYYDREGKLDHAIDMLYQFGQEGQFPYGSASRVIQKLGPEQQDAKQQLFTIALSSFQNSENSNEMRFGFGGFPSMVEQFYKDMPASLVHQAIDVILDKAKKEGEKQSKDSSPTISIASAKGAVQFNSIYNYRLFQLLPVLRTIDPEEADRLLKEQNDVQTLLGKYPEGMASVSGDPTGAGKSNTSFSFNSGGSSGRGGSGPDPAALLDMQREAQVNKQAEEHPQDAMANAATLQAPNLKTSAYVTIARQTWKKNPSLARQALEKAVDSVDKMNPEVQSMSVSEIARLYMQLKDEEGAKKVIELGVANTDKLYRADLNPDDPNKAPKAYWPSTVAWRSMLSLASEISPLWAANLLKEIPDDEIRTLAQMGIATALLHAQSPQTEIMSYTKNDGRMMIMNTEEKPR